MLSNWQNVGVIVLSIVLALGFLVLLRAVWPPALRREHNDLIGWQISVLGTTYAVIIAFMLWNVWSNFQSAEINTEVEANSLVNIYRFAQGLPPTQAAEVQKLAREYANVMLKEEWPAMSQQHLSRAGFNITQQLWTAMLQSQVRDGTRPVSLGEGQVFAELTTMTQHRRIRELQSRSSLPAILWAVLIVGGVITVGSSCLFGTGSFKLHFILVFALSLLLSLVLVAIAEIDRPFQGPVHVKADAFSLARDTFEQVSGSK